MVQHQEQTSKHCGMHFTGCFPLFLSFFSSIQWPHCSVHMWQRINSLSLNHEILIWCLSVYRWVSWTNDFLASHCWFSFWIWMNAPQGAHSHSGQCAMCCEVTEGFVSTVEAGKGMCWRSDKSYVGHPCTLSWWRGHLCHLQDKLCYLGACLCSHSRRIYQISQIILLQNMDINTLTLLR